MRLMQFTNVQIPPLRGTKQKPGREGFRAYPLSFSKVSPYGRDLKGTYASLSLAITVWLNITKIAIDIKPIAINIKNYTGYHKNKGIYQMGDTYHGS